MRGYLKPISTLRRPLASVDFATREPVKAAYERSDVCVVPAAGVAAEAMVALTLARCALEKFGGDSMTETRRNFEGYLRTIEEVLDRRILHDLSHREVWRSGAGTTCRAGHRIRRRAEEAGRRHVRVHVRGARRRTGRAADRHLQALAVIDVTFKEDPNAKLVLANPEIIHTEGRQTQNEGCLSIPEFRENGDARAQGHRPRAGCERQMVRENRRRTAGARLSARNRSPERQALHQPHQRAQARPDEAQDPQADEGGRVVELGSESDSHERWFSAARPRLPCPLLKSLVEAGFRSSPGCHAARPPAGPRHGTRRFAGEAAALRLGLPVIQPDKDQEQRGIPRATRSASQPDAIIVVGYGRIIPQWMIDLPPHRQPQSACVAAAEVSRRRAHPVGDRAWRNGHRRHHHAHRCRPRYRRHSAAERRCPFTRRHSCDAGAATGAERARISWSKPCAGLQGGTITPRPQDDAQATLAPILKKEDGRIDFSRTARKSEPPARISALARSVYTISRQGTKVDQRHA